MPAKKTMKGRTSKSARPAKMDAIALLKEDHERVRDLLSKLEKTTDRATGKREQLLSQIDRERFKAVRRHSSSSWSSTGLLR